MVVFSCLFWRLATDGQTTAAILALITLVVSVAVSHVRAEAEAAKVVLTEAGKGHQHQRTWVALVRDVAPARHAGHGKPRCARHHRARRCTRRAHKHS